VATAPPSHLPSFRRLLITGAIAWTLVIGGFSLWSANGEREQAVETAQAEARTSVRTNLGFRRWASMHGGVYVPPTETTPPNRYLKMPNRDVVTTTGQQLTLMNPAYMLRELVQGGFIGKGRITAQRPINPMNAPDEWEAIALERLVQGAPEVAARVVDEGKPAVRVMLPVFTEKACLKCHGQDGYREGELRGAIDVTLPLQPYLDIANEEIRTSAISHAIIWLIGLAGIFGVWRMGSARLRRQAEMDYRLHVTQFSMDRAHDAIFWLDPDGDFVYVNDAGCTMLGYRRDELLALSVHEVSPSRTPETWADHWRQLEEVGALQFESYLRTKTGDRVSVEISANLIRYGSQVHNVAVVRDIGERKRAEATLKQALSDVGRANSELEKFTDVLAHHLQEPVRLQHLFAQRLASLLPSPAAPDLRQALDFVIEGAMRQRTLLRDAQLYLSIDRLPAPAKPCAAVAALDLARGRLQQKIAASGALIDHDELPWVLINVNRLTDVFHILLDNSIEYAQPGTVPHIHIGARMRDGLATLWVSDNGIGIPAEFHNRVFGLFERLSPKTGPTQTGLGLALAKKIVETANGRIWVEPWSEPGTMICFVLPASEEDGP
jgi:PAS domain S-box-containing protein